MSEAKGRRPAATRRASAAWRLAIALSLAWIAAPACADSPLPPPQTRTECSPSGMVCATSDLARGITEVRRKGSRQPLWSIAGWHRWFFVSDDGESLVVGHEEMNLVPTWVTLAEPVLFFHRRGGLVRTVALSDLYRRKSQLQKTVSHLAWVGSLGFNRAGQFVVERIDGRPAVFAADTGLPARPVGIDPLQPLLPKD